MPDKYVTEIATHNRKVCPLTGEVADYRECERNDCSDVTWDKCQCEIIDGVKRFYKCAHERAWMIESSKRRKPKRM